MTRSAFKILLLGGFAGVAAAGAAGAAGASPASSDVPTLTVQFKSEMLATDSGARALHRRLARAAEQVCPPQPSSTRLIPDARRLSAAQSIKSTISGSPRCTPPPAPNRVEHDEDLAAGRRIEQYGALHHRHVAILRAGRILRPGPLQRLAVGQFLRQPITLIEYLHPDRCLA